MMGLFLINIPQRLKKKILQPPAAKFRLTIYKILIACFIIDS